MHEEDYQNLLLRLVEYDALVRGEDRHSPEYLKTMADYWHKVGRGSLDDLLWSMDGKFPEKKHGGLKYWKAAELIHNNLAFQAYVPVITRFAKACEKNLAELNDYSVIAA